MMMMHMSGLAAGGLPPLRKEAMGCRSIGSCWARKLPQFYDSNQMTLVEIKLGLLVACAEQIDARKAKERTHTF